MAVPKIEKRYYQKDRVEHSIDRFSSKKNPTPADLIAVSVTAQVELGVENYRLGADEMKRRELRDEKHESSRLAGHLEDTGDWKPHPQCHAHAIVSGAHKDAAPMRAILAFFKIRIEQLQWLLVARKYSCAALYANPFEKRVVGLTCDLPLTC